MQHWLIIPGVSCSGTDPGNSVLEIWSESKCLVNVRLELAEQKTGASLEGGHLHGSPTMGMADSGLRMA